MTCSDEAIISFEGVSFSYGGAGEGRAALRGLDLRVRAGEFVAVIGRDRKSVV